MKKQDLFKGLLLGILVALTCSFVIFLVISKGNTEFSLAYQYLKANDLVGKVITLGSIPNLFLFFFLLNRGKEMMSRGIILSLFVLTIFTLIL
ncbi:hypothetical protein [Flavobacterium sp.]|uniref:hypothetical protein n=1 Tax=Flavobacterium sp. TaxID=239 RepID=UPI0035278A36